MGQQDGATDRRTIPRKIQFEGIRQMEVSLRSLITVIGRIPAQARRSTVRINFFLNFSFAENAAAATAKSIR